jgi:hypothetical protein
MSQNVPSEAGSFVSQKVLPTAFQIVMTQNFVITKVYGTYEVIQKEAF